MIQLKAAALALGVVAAAAVGGLTAAKQQQWFSTLNPDNDLAWAKKIQQGGYILHFRHAQREKWTDVTAFDAIELLNNYTPTTIPFPRATCLTERGVQEAKLIRASFEAANVGVEKVIASPSCRCVQTAEHAWGRVDQIANSLLHRTAIAPRQHLEFNKDLRQLILGLKPSPGKNIVLSGHGGTLRLDSGIVIDQNDFGEGIDDRDETGFVVLEIAGDKIVARYKFRSIMFFTNAIIELPVVRDAAEVSTVAK